MALAGDAVLAVVIVVLVGTGIVAFSNFSSAIAYVLVAGIAGLTIWGVREPVEGRVSGKPQQKETKTPVALTWKVKPTETRTTVPLTWTPVEESPAPSKPSKSQEQDVVADETKVIKEGQFEFYPNDISSKERLIGTVTAKEPVDLFIVDEDGFDRWQRNKSVEMYEQRDGIKRFNIDFRPPRKDTWYLMLDNSGEEDAEVTVYLKVVKA